MALGDVLGGDKCTSGDDRDLPVQCGQHLAPVTAFFCGVHRGSRRKSNGFADFNFIQLQEAVVILGEHHSSQSCALFP